MMNTNSHLKYAKALFNVALRKQQEEAVLNELEIVTALFLDKNFAELMKKMSFCQREVIEKTLDAAFKDKVGELVLNTMKMLAHAHKLDIFPKISDSYRQLFNASKGVDEIVIRSARKLDETEKKKVIDQLKQKNSRPISVRFEQDSDLIAGMQIYEKGYLQDYSVQNYLHSLEKYLLTSELDNLTSAPIARSSSTKDSPTQAQLF